MCESIGSHLQSPDHVREVYVARTSSIEQCAGILCNPLSRQVPPPQEQLERQPLSISRRLTVASQDVDPIQATDWWIVRERRMRSMVVVEMQVFRMSRAVSSAS